MKKKDLEQIRDMMAEFFNKGFANVWEYNFEPVFNGIESRFIKIEDRLINLEKRVDNLPTKEYLDQKIGELRGEFNLRYKSK